MSGQRREAEERPAWWYDEHLVAVLAMLNPLVFLIEIGGAPPIDEMPVPDWWHAERNRDPKLRRHLPDDCDPAPVTWCVSRPRLIRPRLLLVSFAHGHWHDLETDRKGADLVGLAAYRLGCSKASAAWRIARWAGRKEPR